MEYFNFAWNRKTWHSYYAKIFWEKPLMLFPDF